MAQGNGTRKVPVVCAVLEGGTSTIKAVHQYLTQELDIPVIVCDGSGRASDLIAFASRYIDTDGTFATEVRDQMLSLISTVFPEYPQSPVHLFETIVQCARRTDLLTIFRYGEDRQEDVDHSILTAVLKRQNLSLPDQVTFGFLHSSASTGINCNPKLPSPLNTPLNGFSVDVVGCPGSTHECVFRIVVHNPFSSPVTIFHKKFFLLCLASNEMHMLSRLVLSTPNCSLSPFRVCDGFSSNNDFKASVFVDGGVPERCRSLTSKSPNLKQFSVEYAVFGGSSYSNYFVRLSLPLNLDLWFFTNYKLALTLSWNRVDVARSCLFGNGKHWPINALHAAMSEALRLDRVKQLMNLSPCVSCSRFTIILFIFTPLINNHIFLYKACKECIF
uniref:LSDAT_euk domain-containing protein n=1 Tax=Heterorhabditis bacteriophora TaxID=37862 RepID=A0A1I7WIJ9_HETBA